MGLKAKDELLVFSQEFGIWCRAVFEKYSSQPDVRISISDKLLGYSSDVGKSMLETAKEYKVLVYLIDFGIHEEVYLFNTRGVFRDDDDDSQIFNRSIYPLLHTRCKLLEVSPDGHNWTDDAIEFMKKLVWKRDIVSKVS